MRIPYDIETHTWGKLETVLLSSDAGLSIGFPRISPNGKFLLCCMMDYGYFATFSPTSDLYMMNLETGRHWRLDINSDKADAYHSWSSNSHWIAFTSKRRDGLFARPYLSYIDGEGNARKPVLLPQKDPGFYDSCIRIWNVPELVKEPVRTTRREIARAIYTPARAIQAELDPRVKPFALSGAGAKEPPPEKGPTE